MKDLYQILGLTEDDKKLSGDKFEKKLKKQYKKLCLTYHPDKQVGKSDKEQKEAEEKFKEINEAYSILSDASKKQQYDLFGTTDNNNRGGFDDFDSFYKQHFDGFDPFNPFRYKQQNNIVINGENIRIRYKCTLEDIYNNAQHTIKYKKQGKCPDCDGTGSLNGELVDCPICHGTGAYKEYIQRGMTTVIKQTSCPHCHGLGKVPKLPCSKCNGTGLVETTQTATITIPQGVTNDTYIMLQGLGHDAPNKLGSSGSLIVVFEIKEHPYFKLNENGVDLTCSIDVDILDCITGCDKTIKCLDNTEVKLKVPKFSKHKDVLTIRGKGMPNRNHYGDLFITINQIMPNDLSKEELELINKLKLSKNFK